MAHPPGLLLGPLLKPVSRSFYLSLRILPRGVREPVGLAYLFARTADTIADTRLLPRADRLVYLEVLRDAFLADVAAGLSRLPAALAPHQHSPAERTLLLTLPETFAAYQALPAGDRAAIRRVLLAITQGMRMDLSTFPGEGEGRVAALGTRADLDRYTYWVAGSAGEFWTDIHLAHRPALADWDAEAMRRRAVRFGRGLQMTNILRDVDQDLALGRAYFPQPRLEAAGVTPEELRAGRSRSRLKPILDDLLELTMGHYRAGWEYTLAIPRRLVRLRLACAWPLLIGLRTLARLAESADPYAPGTVHKVPRAEVKSILRRSFLRIASNRRLDALFKELAAGLPEG